FMPSSDWTTSIESTVACSPPHAYDVMPSHGFPGLPHVASRSDMLPSPGTVIGLTEKLSLHCATTGATTPRLLMISISASVGSAPDELPIAAPVCVCVSACDVLSD